MVKNEKGGSKSKKLGRKHVNESSGKSNNNTNINVRYAGESGESGEIYAVVSKMYGNNMCLVECADGISRNCIIRKKFTGRRKKGNELTQGVWVLVGERDWEILVAGKKPRCDLLEVYSSEEKNKIEAMCGDEVIRLSKLKFENDDKGGGGDSSFDFVNSETSLYEKIISEESDEKNNDNISNKKLPLINIDDI